MQIRDVKIQHIFKTDRPTTDRPTDLTFWKTSNGHISATGYPIHFTFGSRVGFRGRRIRMDLLPVGLNPRPPSWKIWNDHISGMSYPIHFHELQSSFGGIQEKIMREEVIRLVTI